MNMNGFISVLMLCCTWTCVLTLKCYDCNVYGDKRTGPCAITDCPQQYNYCVTSSFTPTSAASECYHVSDKGKSYRGTFNKAIGKADCIAWDKANFTYNPTSYPGIGLGSHNHCRNPDGDMKPWCYTSLKEDFSYCNIPECFKHQVVVEEHACGWLDRDYCKDTLLGRKCRKVCDTDLCNEPTLPYIAVEKQDKSPRSDSLAAKEDQENSAMTHGVKSAYILLCLSVLKWLV